MYKKHFSLIKEPFNITPDPEFLFLLNTTHKEALASMIYGIEKRKGFVMITGDVGLGKTTIIRSYLERSKQEQQKVIYIFNSNISFKFLLENLFREMDVDPGTDDVSLMVNNLHQLLIEEYKKGLNIVLIIDEAQNMPVETLENLRMLSNLETPTDKLIQIVLIGQPELETMLNRNELRQLKQRIAVRSRIAPLSKKESLAYIDYRLKKSLIKRANIFNKDALELIVKAARGVPRVLNILCDNALVTGYGYKKDIINSKIAREVIADVDGKTRSFSRSWMTAAAVILVVAGIFFFFPYKNIVLSKIGEHNLRIISRQAEQIGIWLSPDRKTTGAITIEEDPGGVALGLEVPDFLPIQKAPDTIPEKEILMSSKPVSYITKVAKKGDFLTKLILETYGFTNDAAVEWISRENQIGDIDNIAIGQKIKFPELSQFINNEGLDR